ncbi:MAG: hypothetical protein KAT76_05290 [Bacteroidales bacterium]|nr:hypothetical protein [Bacteroidales bacterium]
MKKYIFTLFIATLISLQGHTQNAVDALRYSQLYTGGTARYMAMGGAFGALGGDFTSLSNNPGGLGIYKSSEFNFTPSIHVGSSNSLYNGYAGNDSKTNFAIGNAAYVYTKRLSSRANQPGFRHFQFAMGLNRLNDYNRRMVMAGENTENSLLDTYVQFADGIFYKDIENNRGGLYGFDLYPAWWTYLLDADTATSTYFSPIPNGGTMQRKIMEQWGSMNEWSFGFGTNYQDILYLGMSFNIPWIRYFERSTYSETDIADTIYDFNRFNVYDRIETRGTGFNLKFGFILRPFDFLRIGGAVHTPSWFNMRDYWDRSMESYFDNGDYYTQASPYGNFRYKLTTPLRLQGSLAFIIGQYGLISGEYEYVDYSNTKFRSVDYGYFDENNDISTSYVQGHNIKAGTEWRSGPFSFRAGYAYQNSPYRSGINDGALSAYSGGIGYKDKFYYLDFAYVFTKKTEDYYFYGTDNISVNPVINELIDHRFLVTFGTRF